MQAETFLAGRPIATAVYDRVLEALEELGPVTVRTTKSQIAFRRSRGFAFLWIPGQYLARPRADVVLSIALGRHVVSPRFKEVNHPSARHWIHHLELDGPDDIDD
jgi:hypothetical protein